MGIHFWPARNAPERGDALVRKNIRIKIVLILTRTPAGPNLLTHKAGLLTYSLYRAFPTAEPSVAKSAIE